MISKGLVPGILGSARETESGSSSSAKLLAPVLGTNQPWWFPSSGEMTPEVWPCRVHLGVSFLPLGSSRRCRVEFRSHHASGDEAGSAC